MDCKQALAIVAEWCHTHVLGREAEGSNGDPEEAFVHIRECKGKKCSLVRDDLERAWRTAIGFGEGLEPTFKY